MLNGNFVEQVEKIAGTPSDKQFYTSDKLANLMHRLSNFDCKTEGDSFYRSLLFNEVGNSLDVLVCMQREIVFAMRKKFTKKELEFMFWSLSSSLFDWHQDLLIFKRTLYDYIRFESNNWFNDTEREELRKKIGRQNNFEFALFCSVILEVVNTDVIEIGKENAELNPDCKKAEDILLKFLTK